MTLNDQILGMAYAKYSDRYWFLEGKQPKRPKCPACGKPQREPI